jgi:hypothetical protein
LFDLAVVRLDDSGVTGAYNITHGGSLVTVRGLTSQDISHLRNLFGPFPIFCLSEKSNPITLNA